MGEVSWNSIDKNGVQVTKKNGKFTVVCSRFVLHKTLNVVISRCGFADDGKKNVPKHITHVQGDCFPSLNCFVALSLPSPSSLLKFPNSSVEATSFPGSFDSGNEVGFDDDDNYRCSKDSELSTWYDLSLNKKFRNVFIICEYLNCC